MLKNTTKQRNVILPTQCKQHLSSTFPVHTQRENYSVYLTSKHKASSSSSVPVWGVSLIFDALLEESFRGRCLTQFSLKSLHSELHLLKGPCFHVVRALLLSGAADHRCVSSLQRADLTEAALIDPNWNRTGRGAIPTNGLYVLVQAVACQQRERWQNWTRDRGKELNDINWHLPEEFIHVKGNPFWSQLCRSSLPLLEICSTRLKVAWKTSHTESTESSKHVLLLFDTSC